MRINSIPIRNYSIKIYPIGFLLFTTLFYSCGQVQNETISTAPAISHEVIVSDSSQQTNDSILSYRVNPKLQSIKFYWKDTSDKAYFNFSNLKSHIEAQGEKLVFAVNGGIFTREHKPLGLYIENGKILHRKNNVQKAYGNFYLQPNGIFYITKNNEAFVTTTKDFIMSTDINYATQSGPMLVINDTIHPKFNKDSKNLNIRNGVGILPNGNILFAMTKKRLTLYDFAVYFKNAGCKNALYLDGAISKTYCPSKGYKNTEGTFIILIGVTE